MCSAAAARLSLSIVVPAPRVHEKRLQPLHERHKSSVEARGHHAMPASWLFMASPLSVLVSLVICKLSLTVVSLQIKQHHWGTTVIRAGNESSSKLFKPRAATVGVARPLTQKQVFAVEHLLRPFVQECSTPAVLPHVPPVPARACALKHSSTAHPGQCGWCRDGQTTGLQNNKNTANTCANYRMRKPCEICTTTHYIPALIKSLKDLKGVEEEACVIERTRLGVMLWILDAR